MMTFMGFPSIEQLPSVPQKHRFYKNITNGQKKFTCHTNKRYQHRVAKKYMKTKDTSHYQRNK